MSVEPDLSVVVAAYNAADTLPVTLRSLLAQSLESIEVVVVDDGSTDDTAAIVRAAASDDDRIRLIQLEANAGRSAARNRGLAEARGRWIGTCDADDLWACHRAERLIDAAERWRVDVVTDDQMGFSVGGSDGAVVLNHRYASRATLWMGREHCIRRRGWFFDQTCVMRPIVRATFPRRCRADYPVHLANGEDLAFYLQLVFDPSAPCILRVGEPLYYYREGQSMRVAAHTDSWSNHFDLLTSYPVERTGSLDLDRWSRKASPGRNYVDRRFYRIMLRRGRLVGEAQSLPPGDHGVSPARGWGLLIRRLFIKTVSRISDRTYRDAVVTDIATQLAGPPVR